ncbi:MAG: type II secretion system F family protein [Candidatus Bathyarchaeia archaeon]
MTRFSGLKTNLAKVSRVSFEVYLGLLVFSFLVVSAATFVVSAVVFSFSMPVVQTLGVAFLLAVVTGLGSVGVFYLLSIIQISSRARKIDANLPLVANFMAVLANSGMPPERILRSLGNVGDEFGVGEEVRRAVGDVELMGLDLKGALRNAAARSSSGKFASLLNGVITTSHMGGDLDAYLREKANTYKKARRLSMKSFLESLNSVAEVYVSFMVALPLALIIMLSVMSFIGGGVSIFGGLDPYVLLMLITFLVTPAGVGILLLLVDSLTPPR